jgi:hypothetical protein
MKITSGINESIKNRQKIVIKRVAERVIARIIGVAVGVR